jgi:hypothetical protein
MAILAFGLPVKAVLLHQHPPPSLQRGMPRMEPWNNTAVQPLLEPGGLARLLSVSTASSFCLHRTVPAAFNPSSVKTDRSLRITAVQETAAQQIWTTSLRICLLTNIGLESAQLNYGLEYLATSRRNDRLCRVTTHVSPTYFSKSSMVADMSLQMYSTSPLAKSPTCD